MYLLCKLSSIKSTAGYIFAYIVISMSDMLQPCSIIHKLYRELTLTLFVFWVLTDYSDTSTKPDVSDIPEKKDTKVLELNKPYEEMSVEELQAAILEKLAKNGPVTDQMRKDVMENVYPNSLLNWVKSFH